MKFMHRAFEWSAVAACTAVVLAVATGCGGDDTDVMADDDAGALSDGKAEAARPDSQADSSYDAREVGEAGDAARDGSIDVVAEDTGKADVSDGSSPDATDAGPDVVEAGPADVSVVDVLAEATNDASDASAASSIVADADAGLRDAAIESSPEASPPLTLSQYQLAIASAWCDRTAECCQLSSTQFDRALCVSLAGSGFGPDAVNKFINVYAGNFPATLVFDPSQAAQCVQAQRTRSCTANGPEKHDLYATCVTAVQGTLNSGNVGCRTSLECIGGLYCKLPTDGGLGVCTPVAGAGQACDDPLANSEQCTYLGVFVSTSSHCSSFADNGGTCVAPLPIGSSCNGNQECATQLCSNISGTCVNSHPYPPPSLCTVLTKKDGG
jgi:hypothetical protein